MTKEQVVTLMKSSSNGQEWDANCDKVKAACNGYPDFWFETIVMSGLLKQVGKAWGDSDADKIHLVY